MAAHFQIVKGTDKDIEQKISDLIEQGWVPHGERDFMTPDYEDPNRDVFSEDPEDYGVIWLQAMWLPMTPKQGA